LTTVASNILLFGALILAYIHIKST
jgi:hypothetical protein